jgi:hypothetical protein
MPPGHYGDLMSLTDFWQRYRERRTSRYLQTHSALALEMLRRDPVLGAQALQSFFALQAAQDGPQRTTFQFPSLQSFGLGGQGRYTRAVAKPLSFQTRAFGEYPPARRAINALTNPILDLPFTITVRRPLSLSAYEVGTPPTADQQRRILAATLMIERPNNEHSGREFLEMILEDLICLGAGPFEVADNPSDERPLLMWPVECETLRINTRWQPGFNVPRYSQSKAYAFGSSADGDEVQLRDDQLCYPKLNPRSHTPFGLGYLEIAFSVIDAYIGAFAYATRKASNATPNDLIFLGENVTIDQVRQWSHYWETEIEGMGKIPILGGGRAPTVASLRGSGTDPLYLAWQEWLVRVIAMSFGLSAMKLGIERDVNYNTADAQSEDDWETVAPIAGALRDAFTHWLLHRRLGWTDLEFQWTPKITDETKQAEILSLQYAMNAATINEIREKYKREPLENGLGDLTRTAFETAVKTQAAILIAHEAPPPEPPVHGVPPRPAAQEQAAFALMTPFDDVEEGLLSPREAVFVRALMRNMRQGTNGHSPVVKSF